MSNRALAGWLAMLALAVLGAILLGSVRPVRWWVVALLMLSVVLSEMFPVRLGRITYAGSDLAMWLVIVVIGPWPAVVAACVGNALGAARRRVPLRLAICDQAIFSFVATAGSAMILGLEQAGLAVPGEAGLPIAVLLLAWAGDGLNLTLLAVGSPMMRGLRIRDAFRQHWLPVVPWMTLTAGLAAGTAHAYYTLGPGAIAVGVLLHGGAQVLLKTIEREERQRVDVHAAFQARDQYLADALEAEARERRKVALELHDDALQNLLVARQELAGAGVPRADERVAAAIDVMRGLVTRQYQLETGPVELHGRLQQMIEIVTAQGGFRYLLEVGEDPGGPASDLLVALARELVVNAIKHSGGTLVRVHVAREAGSLRLTVADDGHGFEPGGVDDRLRDGHLGLTAVRDRVKAQGGRVDFAATPSGGAEVRVRLPDERVSG
jgi:two-component system NarL family sensor kinase